MQSIRSYRKQPGRTGQISQAYGSKTAAMESLAAPKGHYLPTTDSMSPRHTFSRSKSNEASLVSVRKSTISTYTLPSPDKSPTRKTGEKSHVTTSEISEITENISTISIGSSARNRLPRASSPSIRLKEYASTSQKEDLSSPDKSSMNPRAIVGLQNLGNTCFMNAVLQCLNNIPEIAILFQNQNYAKDINRTTSSTKGKLASAFGELVSSMWQGSPHAICKPVEVKQVVGKFASRFLGYEQQDAQEFLRFLLDGLHEDLNRITEKPPYYEIKDRPTAEDREISDEYWKYYVDRNQSALSEMFCGQLKSVVICQTCQHRSVCFDVFWDLSVPMPSKVRKFSSRFSVLSRNDPASPTSGNATLTECLDLYTKEESLLGDYYCSNSSSLSQEKVNIPLSFPFEGLDLTKHLAEDAVVHAPPRYSCVGVTNHLGSLNGGHYVADCLNPVSSSWYNYNDSTVTELTKPNPNSSSAYILFFRRKDLTPGKVP